MDKPDSRSQNQSSEKTSPSAQDSQPSSSPMFGDETLTPTVLKAHAAELIEKGEMPSLDEFLDAIEETRKEFAPKILKAREDSKVN